tara:strand:+ start:16267 stop:17565 length:1299 start_codon:yes stop_codon:yes gene_type:complete
MAGEGNRGSSSGMRFNPREGPEFMEEDRNLGRDDAESRQLLDEKKRKEKEDRQKKLVGLQHLSVKVVGKKRPQGDDQRNDERLSEMTGPASSTGYPLDVATGAKTGSGSAMGGNPTNIMTGHPIEIDLDAILKKKKSSGKKRKKSDNIKSIKTRQRGKETRRRRAKMGDTALSRTYKGGGVRGFRDTEGYTQTRATIAQRTEGSGGKNAVRRGHGGRGKGWRHSTSGKGTKREATPDPRKVQANVETSQMARQIPTHTSGYQLPSAQAYENVMKPAPKGAPIDHPQNTAAYFTPKKSSQVSRPGVARTVGGQQIESPGGPTDGMTGFQTASLLTSFERLLEYEGIISKAKISSADITEFRFLVRELKKLLRSGALKKAGFEDAEHDDGRPSANAHRKTTSHPTGATEVDPDDDPRYWGAHPLGLLLPRRGHM